MKTEFKQNTMVNSVREILMLVFFSMYSIACAYAAVPMDPNYKTPKVIKAALMLKSNLILSTSLSKSRSNIITPKISGGNVITVPHGGSAENAILIIDPTVPESMYIGNYYKNARNIPDRNVFYMNASASATGTDYNAFAAVNLPAFFGTLDQQQISDHINYIIIAPLAVNSSGYAIYDDGHLSSGCVDAYNFSIASAYTTAFMANTILGYTDNNGSGGFNVLTFNQYGYNTSSFYETSPLAFDSAQYWSNGQPTASVNPTSRFFIGTLLGYVGAGTSGPNVMSVGQITAMIDRSVAVDGTHPTGTFYYMNTSDSARDSRSFEFSLAEGAINSAGGQAVILNEDLPIGENDVLGVMSGFAGDDIQDTNMTILPGAFTDHLTSYAGVLNSNPQEGMLNWIIKGASGTDGTVEEPCNYISKFPDAYLHYYYYEGLSLGESYLRSMLAIPFQNLFLGDPLTRPFGYFPSVNATLPSNPVSGTITITATAMNNNPNATGILGLDLYVDGILKQTVLSGQNFQLDTTQLSDGFHDIRVVSYDNSAIATPGRWVGQLQVNNYNRGTINLTASPTSGDLSTLFGVTISSTSSSSPVAQVRLLENNRVIAASSSLPASFNVLGYNLGAGPVNLVAEVEYSDGVLALSQPFALNISFNPCSTNVASSCQPPILGTSSGPLAFSYTKYLVDTSPVIVELPAYDNISPGLTYSIVQGPAQASVLSFGSTYGTIILQPQSTALGTDTIIFQASSSGGSAQGTVTLKYASSADVSGNGTTTMYDAALAAINLAQGGVCASTGLTTTQCTIAEMDHQGNGETIDSTDVIDIAKKAMGIN